MTDKEKIEIYEKHFTIDTMKKINTAIEQKQDIEIKHKDTGCTVYAKKISIIK